jgi:hypothetical protein
MRGDDVRTAQMALTGCHTDPQCGIADGFFGIKTRDSVIDFQKRYPDLKKDGVINPATWNKLMTDAYMADAGAPAIRKAAAATVPTPKPPLSEEQVGRVKDWMMRNFGAHIMKAAANSPFDVDLICAIACKETACEWLPWMDDTPPDEILARCVFDASGDVPGHPRHAHPCDTAEFRKIFGDDLAEMLIAEANMTRRKRKMDDAKIVYKGYGIFQYDLQNIFDDPDFFRKKLWYRMDDCLDRLFRLLRVKWEAADRDLENAVCRYNGSGCDAFDYAKQVMLVRDWSTRHDSSIDLRVA